MKLYLLTILIFMSFFVKDQKMADVDYKEKNMSPYNTELLSDETEGIRYMDNSVHCDNVKPVEIDTASLTDFWNTFQKNLRSNNRQEVQAIIRYPIHAIYAVLFQYAFDCDTMAYVKNSEKYNDFDIDHDNMTEYYDFVFTDTLKEIVYQTSVNDLLSKGYRYKNKPGMAYDIYPKYYITVNCSSDHLLRLYIGFEDKRWTIGIGGL